MKTENNSSLNEDERQLNTRIYNTRACPACGAVLFGMPGGPDAHCPNCGYKDPCCSD